MPHTKLDSQSKHKPPASTKPTSHPDPVPRKAPKAIVRLVERFFQDRSTRSKLHRWSQIVRYYSRLGRKIPQFLCPVKPVLCGSGRAVIVSHLARSSSPIQSENPGNMLSKSVRTLVTGSIATSSPPLGLSSRSAARGIPDV